MKQLNLLIFTFLLLSGGGTLSLASSSPAASPRARSMAKSVIATRHLRVEQLTNPLGVDAKQPRLSWQIASNEQSVMQIAYHVLVASSPEKLARNEGDLWDSGKVMSDASQWITYAGTSLKSNTRCYWKVKVHTNKGEAPWSLSLIHI